jgi:hypothetical protein
MTDKKSSFSEAHVLHELSHYLPTQAPLKDFIHHNSLHAFQDLHFHEGVSKASSLFGYKVYFGLEQFRQLYTEKRIDENILDHVIISEKGASELNNWKNNLLIKEYDTSIHSRIGLLRDKWKELYKVNLDKDVFQLLFRIIGSYLDQGISIWDFPVSEKGLLHSIREIEKNSFNSFFKGKRAKKLLMDSNSSLEHLLEILVGDPELYEQYLFDQQFSHSGWSGMVSVLEHQPESLLDKRKVSVHDFIYLECLFEIDILDAKFSENWLPLGLRLQEKPIGLFDKLQTTELSKVYKLWQEAFEWTYYDQVLKGIQLPFELTVKNNEKNKNSSFQGLFCIDDRECSFRRYIEKLDSNAETYGTPGFFNVEFYFQPEHSKFHTKVCPAPIDPKFIIKEYESENKPKKDRSYTKHTHGLLGGIFSSQILGFWSAFRLLLNVFKPTESPAMVSSSGHMDKLGKLTFEFKGETIEGLQVGFTVEQMADRLERLLKSIGLVEHFAPIVYAIGHGASSINNTHYAGYDCGACFGRPGSVNARVIAAIGNNKQVRIILKARGIDIPESCVFIGGLHDTTRDDIEFFEEDSLSGFQKELHDKNKQVFKEALDLNAKERSRRFVLINTKGKPKEVHRKVKLRSVSLFEPRPELNHATNALCIVGRRSLTKNLFLDRRSFLNSYDYRVDPNGEYLLGILKAAAPVCGGINLEYYFSRVDNYKLGAGTKLPHNVIGLIGVANGMDGDLRPGLPSQMIEVHDPIRLMIIVEQFPHIVEQTIKISEPTYEWFKNEWVHLIVVHPETGMLFRFKNEVFESYYPICKTINEIPDVVHLIETSEENFPVYKIQA